MNEPEFSIQELCDQTGLPRRTIHFYTQQEIIPPPASSGLGARYQRGHLVRLKLIPIFREQGLRLDEIREKFTSISPVELEKILAASTHPTATPKQLPSPATLTSADGMSQSYQVFHLPRGVTVMAPDQLSPAHLAKIKELCQKIEQALAH